MARSDFTILNKIQQTVENCTKKSEAYLSVQEELSQDLKNSTKDLYDLAVKTKSLKLPKSAALPELIIKDFDTEQIWQQLELKNNEEFSRLSLSSISKALAGKNSWLLPLKVRNKVSDEESEYSDGQDKSEEDFITETLNDIESTNVKHQIKRKTVTTNVKKRRRTTEVDDKFFKLDDLHEYLNKEDKRATKNKNDKSSDSDDDDKESIDLFNNFDNSEFEEEEEEGKNKNGRLLKYADFFDSPESGNEHDFDNNEEKNKDDDRFYDDENEIEEDMNDDNFCENQLKKFKADQKQVKFNLLDNTIESDSTENSKIKNEENDNNTKESLSSLEIKQQKLKKIIKGLEEEAIAEKPWQLRGETTASNRPEDSLLQEYLEFDTASRPAPVITGEVTMRLEDIIMKRIKDKSWDDVEKKFKPVETPIEYKKKLIMNQEKSKESLAQIYENEYVKQREALNVEDKDEEEKQDPPEHIEIREKMHSLFRKLDALSNFHYTPKPAKPEIKIISNVPAINIEEVAPVATSDATLLAPEEVQSKQKGELIGKSERTKTDMKRERRKKKQHARALQKSKKLNESVKQNKSLKKKSANLKGSNIINVDETHNKDLKTIKSSTAFFAQLQDQVENSIKVTKKTPTSKKNKNMLSSAKLKL